MLRYGNRMIITNCMLLLLSSMLVPYLPGVDGSHFCQPTRYWVEPTVCADNERCCGIYNNNCCKRTSWDFTWEDIKHVTSPPLRTIEDAFFDPTTVRTVHWPSKYQKNSAAMEVFALLIVLAILIGCPVMCYRCCCKRTVRRGIIYSQLGATADLSATLPLQQDQVPPPTVAPYPQQTLYPPQQRQYPNNPYYGVPLSDNDVTTQQAGVQQVSAPSAPPYLQS